MRKGCIAPVEDAVVLNELLEAVKVAGRGEEVRYWKAPHSDVSGMTAGCFRTGDRCYHKPR